LISSKNHATNLNDSRKGYVIREEVFMRRYVVLCSVLLLYVSCRDGGGFGKSSWNVSKDAKDFHELSITWHGAVAPESVSKDVVIFEDKTVSLNMMQFKDIEKMTDECSGYTRLSDGEFQKVLDLVNKSNLAEYYLSNNCEPLVGTQGVTVTLMRNDKTYNEFTTSCELDPVVQELLDTVEQLVDAAITDCSYEYFVEEKDTQTLTAQ